jgi:hypothetical protein
MLPLMSSFFSHFSRLKRSLLWSIPNDLSGLRPC